MKKNIQMIAIIALVSATSSHADWRNFFNNIKDYFYQDRYQHRIERIPVQTIEGKKYVKESDLNKALPNDERPRTYFIDKRTGELGIQQFPHNTYLKRDSQEQNTVVTPESRETLVEVPTVPYGRIEVKQGHYYVEPDAAIIRRQRILNKFIFRNMNNNLRNTFNLMVPTKITPKAETAFERTQMTE